MRLIGINPDGIIGHSVGELSCAYADGSLTLEETVLLAYYRGLASIESNVIRGLMAAVGKIDFLKNCFTFTFYHSIGIHVIIGLGAKNIRGILPASVDIACHNGPDSCTISGPYEEVECFIKVLEHKDIFVRKVESSDIALHSRYIDEMGRRFYDKAEQVSVSIL